MKNKGVKFLVLLIVLAALGGLIYLVVSKSGGGSKKTLEENIEDKNINYFLYLGQGGNTKYNGYDLIFTGNTVKYEDLSVGNVLTAAFNFLYDNQEERTALDPSLYAELDTQYDMANLDALKGEQVRKAIKRLFGVDWKDKSYSNTVSKFAFVYTYDAEFDVYLRAEVVAGVRDNYLTYKVLETKKDKDVISTIVAIAYANKVENGYDIFSDFSNNNLIKSQIGISLKDWKDEDIEKLQKYKINSKLVDKDYVFDSIEYIK